ncbi:MAG: hypothetical protein ACK4UJ_01540 [Leptonema sp. (in: bacteria)]
MEDKNQYIFVRSISEIDPKKLTIRDLNKKIIDAEGRKYAIRFDFKTKKIEFVRIASSYIEAQRIKQEILKNKQSDFTESQTMIYKEKKEAPKVNFSENKKESDFTIDFSYSEDANIDENQFFLDLEKDTKKCIESLNAIEKNLNRSHHLEKSKMVMNEFFDLQKEIELKCYNFSQEAIKFLKEILYFPRTLNYYFAKIPDSIRKKIEHLNPNEQFEFIKRFEIYQNFKELLTNILTYTKKLENFFYQIPAVERESKPLVDLIPSFSQIKETAEYLLDRLEKWYLKNQL